VAFAELKIRRRFFNSNGQLKSVTFSLFVIHFRIDARRVHASAV